MYISIVLVDGAALATTDLRADADLGSRQAQLASLVSDDPTRERPTIACRP